MTKFNKIITHGGAFHADEILAIATLRKLGVVEKDTEIVRLFNIEGEIARDTIILDVGKKHNCKNMFDHHQSINLPSTNILVLDQFCENRPLAALLMDFLFLEVSNIDRGLVKATKGSFNSLISNFNNVEDGFNRALDFAAAALDALWETSEIALSTQKKWDALGTLFSGRVKVQEDTDFLVGWKEIAMRENVLALLCPNARGGWQIVSVDSDIFTIPQSELQTFLHNSGFMAVYATKSDAIEHLREII